MNERLLRWWREVILPKYATATLGNAVWLGSSTAINAVFGALGAAIVARALGVEEFGLLSLVVSLMTLVVEFSDLGLASAFSRYGPESVANGDLERFRRIASIVFRWRWTICGILIILSLILVRPLLGSVFAQIDERIEGYFAISLIGVVFATLGVTFTPVYFSFKAFRTQALLSITRAGSKVLLIVVFVYVLSFASLTWVLVAEILSAMVFFLAAYAFLPIKGFNLRTRDRETERTIIAFARWIALSQVFAMLATRIDLALIGALSDAMGLGLYSAAQKVIAMMTVIVVSYSSVLFIEMSSTPSPSSLPKKRKEAFAIVLVFVIGIAIAAVVADPLIRILFGTEFSGAVPAFRIMCLGLAFVVAAFPFTATLFAQGRSFAFPVMSGASIAVLVPANMILVPSYGPLGAALAYTLGNAASFLVTVGLTFFLRRTGDERGADA